MKVVVAVFNQEKALVGAYSVIIQLHRLIDLRHYSVESTAMVSPDEEGVVVVGGGAGGRRLQLLQLLDHKLGLNNQISHFMVVISRIPINLLLSN